MSLPTRTRDSGGAAQTRRPGPLGRLAGVAFRHRGRVVLGWIAALAIAIGLSAAFAGDFNADYSTPGSDSKQAQDLLENRFPAQSGDTVDVVVRSDGAVTTPAVKSDVNALLNELRGLPHVATVDNPYTTPGGISQDGQTLIARLNLDVVNPVDMPVSDTDQLLAAAHDAERPGLEIALGGQTIQQAEQAEIGSETIALVVAALILLVTFGTVVAAGLPLGVALAGLAVSGTLTGVIAALTDVPDWSTALATMMGIALGIDYSLLMVTRFREWRAVGLDPERATVATLDTAGRAVLVAGSTVVVSMLGLFAMGLSFMRGAAIVTIVAVFIVMAAAVTLFPALLGYFGRWIDRLRLPLGRRASLEVADGGHVVPTRRWAAWSRTVNRHSIIATVGGVGLLLLLAAPFLGVRYGFPDAGNDPAGKSSRQAYDMVTESFGAGANGPLIVAADLGSKPATGPDDPRLARLYEGLAASDGVQAVGEPQIAQDGTAALINVIPAGAPTSDVTSGLVDQTRTTTIPESGVDAYVGGSTAQQLDLADLIANRLPLIIAVVVGLSILLLLLAFRSVIAPLQAAFVNLLSVGAAYGIVTAVFQDGHGATGIGLDGAIPIVSYVPMMMFAILFGLSMDYQVFLLSRVREELDTGKSPRQAIIDGLAGTGKVIASAGAIMVAVFASFILNGDPTVKEFGVGLAAAILIAASMVCILLPAVMLLMGRWTWWLPRWLDRILPSLNIEGGEAEESAADSEPEPQPV